ncbi:acetyltransferase [Desulfocicer vacuolatum DSM 3385]|uniref:Acetyltransferase n=2 Tax=Desulfocicer vacuolatum TaxID=2298 RepID=A0A1W2DQA8_9BACT|nr:bifunctional acetate--CoA ligase family protein/GNAT family N-acetyltransferase [Desulfocicer vacuolatum]SMC99573.1 acetyltransferase [Desulfocicer vacuolatum DSM 3385]
MGTINMHRMFNPKSVAVIGAGERPGRIGAAIMNNLLNCEFPGEVYPVNPKYDTVMGLPCFSRVSAIGKPVDTAIIATPITGVPDIVEECATAALAGAVIISSGGKEMGASGRRIEKKIMERVKKTNLRIIGPNCLGIVNTAKKFNASFAHQSPLPGKMAFLSQSGAVCTSVLDMAMRENVGFSHFVSLGTMMDVDFADMIDYLGSLKSVESIVMYVENLTNIRSFMSAARSVSRIKPIIALKSGRSKAGARAAASHTGALAGEDSVYDAAFKRAGILRVNEFEELFDCAEFLAKQKQPRGKRLAIITNSGGPGVMAADALAEYGVEPAELSPETIKQLDQFLPANWSRANPVDILGDSPPKHYLQAVRICLDAPEVDGLLLLCSPAGTLNLPELARPLAELLKKTPCPVFTAWIGGIDVDKARQILNQSGIITYDAPERAVRAFVDLYQYAGNIRALQEIPIRTDKRLLIDRAGANRIIKEGLEQGNGILTELEAKKLLEAYGIPVNPTELAVSHTHAVAVAENMGFPVVMKICSRDILHKSDAGGVLLNLEDRDDVKIGFQKLMDNALAYAPDADIAGVTLQPMSLAADYELILGARQDKDFGPILLFGMGGILTEIFKDMATALPPLNRPLARRLIMETKISQVLHGYRNIKKIDLEAMEETLIRLGRLVSDFPEIQEMDINPMMVKQGKYFAVDARVLLTPTTATGSSHLVISPYPWQYETVDETIDGISIFIRPIRPGDASLVIEHFNALSPRSVYMRFFTPVKQLSHSMLVRLTQIDYDREIALVALVHEEKKQKMAGIARVIFEPDGKSGEFAVAVADQWQGKGIGASLLKRCLSYTKNKGLTRVWGLVIAENRQMVKLGKKLGFDIRMVPGSSEYELEIDLTAHNAMGQPGKT